MGIPCVIHGIRRWTVVVLSFLRNLTASFHVKNTFIDICIRVLLYHLILPMVYCWKAPLISDKFVARFFKSPTSKVWNLHRNRKALNSRKFLIINTILTTMASKSMFLEYPIQSKTTKPSKELYYIIHKYPAPDLVFFETEQKLKNAAHAFVYFFSSAKNAIRTDVAALLLL